MQVEIEARDVGWLSCCQGKDKKRRSWKTGMNATRRRALILPIWDRA